MDKMLVYLLLTVLTAATTLILVESGDMNNVYLPCADTTVQLSDGFTFAIAFASRESFFYNGNSSCQLSSSSGQLSPSSCQLSPCDSRLSLATANSQISVFRPKVDEISLLTINSSSFSPDSFNGAGYMVAFAGRKYAARSFPAFVANGTYTVTSFTLVLEFTKGRLQNLYWKRDGCAKCTGNSALVCLNNQDCAIKTTNCKNRSGNVDCSLGIQLAFSGTDKHLSVMNSWYEVENLQQYSLYGLYSNLRDSLTSQYSKIFG